MLTIPHLQLLALKYVPKWQNKGSELLSLVDKDNWNTHFLYSLIPPDHSCPLADELNGCLGGFLVLWRPFGGLFYFVGGYHSPQFVWKANAVVIVLSSVAGCCFWIVSP